MSIDLDTYSPIATKIIKPASESLSIPTNPELQNSEEFENFVICEDTERNIQEFLVSLDRGNRAVIQAALEKRTEQKITESKQVHPNKVSSNISDKASLRPWLSTEPSTTDSAYPKSSRHNKDGVGYTSNDWLNQEELNTEKVATFIYDWAREDAALHRKMMAESNSSSGSVGGPLREVRIKVPESVRAEKAKANQRANSQG